MRAHVIVGGFPPGAPAGHDMDYARLQLLQLLYENAGVGLTVGNDFTDLGRWLSDCRFLITYVAGPFPDDTQNDVLREWIEKGGRWLALHGTSGGRAARLGPEGRARKMVKGSHHATLGSFFLNHPPISKFRVQVADAAHPLTAEVTASFDVVDELYMIELQEGAGCHVLLTTELAKDPSPPGFGFTYDRDTSVLPDGKTRVLGYERPLGQGRVAYLALGHCHAPIPNRIVRMDPSLEAAGGLPPFFRGSWDSPEFLRLLRNGIRWGLA